MWECNFADEPVDFKLFWLRLYQKLGILCLGILVGGLLIGGGYFVKQNLFAPQPEYAAEAETYLEYILREDEPIGWVAFTAPAWEAIIRSREFMEDISSQLNGALTIEELQEAIREVEIPDARIIRTTVITADPELSLAISRALHTAIANFGGKQREIESIRRISDPDQAKRVFADDRTFRAALFGMIVGGLFTLFGICLSLTLDDTVRVPETFEKRYKLPMLGSLGMAETGANLQYLFRDKKRIAVTGMEGIPVGEAASSLQELLQAETEPSLLPVDMEETEKLRDTDSLILVVGAGVHSGKSIEHRIGFLQKQGVAVTAALLWEPEEKLLKRYYGLNKAKRR